MGVNSDWGGNNTFRTQPEGTAKWKENLEKVVSQRGSDQKRCLFKVFAGLRVPGAWTQNLGYTGTVCFTTQVKKVFQEGESS